MEINEHYTVLLAAEDLLVQERRDNALGTPKIRLRECCEWTAAFGVCAIMTSITMFCLLSLKPTFNMCACPCMC